MDWWLLEMSCVIHCRPIVSGSLHIIASHWDVESIFSIFPFLLEMQVCFNPSRWWAVCHWIRAIMGQTADQTWINCRRGDRKYPSCFCKVRVNPVKPAKVWPPETNSDYLYAKQKCHQPEDVVFSCAGPSTHLIIVLISPRYDVHLKLFSRKTSTDSCSLRFLLPRWPLRSHFSFFFFNQTMDAFPLPAVCRVSDWGFWTIGATSVADSSD